jgi:ribose-phosphate pyrophosphokinase
MNNELKIFSGENSLELSNKIAVSCGTVLGKIYHHTFPSGEYYVQFQENIRGSDVFLIQSSCGTMNSNNALMQLLIMADAARRASAKRITAVIPMFFYERQDRKDKSRVPISAKLVMDILAASGINRILTMDLHAQQIAGFTNLPIDCLQFRPTLVKALKNKNIDVVVAPDIGSVKRSSSFAEKINADFAFIAKKRNNDTEVKVMQFVGNVKDKNVLILDDLTESAGTLIEAAKECEKQGAKQIYCAVTHSALTVIGINRIKDAIAAGIITEFFMSNTTNTNLSSSCWTEVDVAPVFSDAITSIHNNESVSSLFD